VSKPTKWGIAAIALVVIAFAFVVWKQDNAEFVHQKCSIATSHDARDLCDWLAPLD
jgi:hypothetical protein